jgi:hypothetical protein
MTEAKEDARVKKRPEVWHGTLNGHSVCEVLLEEHLNQVWQDLRTWILPSQQFCGVADVHLQSLEGGASRHGHFSKGYGRDGGACVSAFLGRSASCLCTFPHVSWTIKPLYFDMLWVWVFSNLDEMHHLVCTCFSWGGMLYEFVLLFGHSDLQDASRGYDNAPFFN